MPACCGPRLADSGGVRTALSSATVPVPREDHPQRRHWAAPPPGGQGPGAEAAAAEAGGAPRYAWSRAGGGRHCGGQTGPRWPQGGPVLSVHGPLPPPAWLCAHRELPGCSGFWGPGLVQLLTGDGGTRRPETACRTCLGSGCSVRCLQQMRNYGEERQLAEPVLLRGNGLVSALAKPLGALCRGLAGGLLGRAGCGHMVCAWCDARVCAASIGCVVCACLGRRRADVDFHRRLFRGPRQGSPYSGQWAFSSDGQWASAT